MPRYTVPAAALMPGDYLPLTRQTVTASPYDSCRCPRGKVNVPLRRNNGVEHVAVWGKRTGIAVERTHA